MAERTRTWMEIMQYVAGDQGRPLVLITLARGGGAALDEMSLASQAGLLHQQFSGQVVETAVMLKHIVDMGREGYIERDSGGFKWQMTPLGTLVSRQWAPANVEPLTEGPLSPDDVRGWRDRLLAVMDEDAELAKRASLAHEELVMTRGPRLSELHVLNRVLGEERLPGWLVGEGNDVGNRE